MSLLAELEALNQIFIKVKQSVKKITFIENRIASVEGDLKILRNKVKRIQRKKPSNFIPGITA